MDLNALRGKILCLNGQTHKWASDARTAPTATSSWSTTASDRGETTMRDGATSLPSRLTMPDLPGKICVLRPNTSQTPSPRPLHSQPRQPRLLSSPHKFRRIPSSPHQFNRRKLPPLRSFARARRQSGALPRRSKSETFTSDALFRREHEWLSPKERYRGKQDPPPEPRRPVLLLLPLPREPRVPPVLKRIVRPRRHQRADLCPPVPEDLVQLHQAPVLRGCPRPMIDRRVEMVYPPLAALLSEAAGQECGEARPALRSVASDERKDRLVLLARPRTAEDGRVQNLPPAIDDLGMCA